MVILEYSFPFGMWFQLMQRIFDSSPNRGDVIVFRKPGDESIDYIKRLSRSSKRHWSKLNKGILYVNGKKAE